MASGFAWRYGRRHLPVFEAQESGNHAGATTRQKKVEGCEDNADILFKTTIKEHRELRGANYEACGKDSTSNRSDPESPDGQQPEAQGPETSLNGAEKQIRS